MTDCGFVNRHACQIISLMNRKYRNEICIAWGAIFCGVSQNMDDMAHEKHHLEKDGVFLMGTDDFAWLQEKKKYDTITKK